MNSQINNEINVFWMRGPKTEVGKGKPISLVAYYVEGTTVHFAVVTHDPVDTFSRTYAHNKAIGRLMCKDYKQSIPILKDLGPEGTIVRHILDMYEIDLNNMIKEMIDHIKNNPPNLVVAARESIETLQERYEKRRELGRM